ncbi:MAG TPA: hypothetical protein VGS16_08315 [Candidatus Dormibacteraeota bacterium]|nr:hypothetical protein [Candidatus Dormibacteraeota bacterium]
MIVPITRLSPAGTALSQWTNDAPPGVPVGLDDGLEVAVAVAVAVACSVGLGDVRLVEGEPPHPVSVMAVTTTIAARLRGTA